MINFVNSIKAVLEQFILPIFMFSCLVGCASANCSGKLQKNNKNTERINRNQKWDFFILLPADYKKFRPGRSKDDILEDIHWKGSFVEAASYKGKSITVIDFGLFGSPFDNSGTIVWSVFVDEKFHKFVRYPDWDSKWDSEKKKIGDHRMLIKAFKSEPVTIAELKKEMKENPPPSSIDWGLTMVWLSLRKGVLEADAKREKSMENIYKKNSKLRDQFNASRLKIGMTENEVEKVLKAKPIQKGKVKAGTFKFYGSTETLDLNSYLLYSNILVVFEKGKVIGIYNIGGGEKGLEDARKWWSSDFPTRK